MWYSAVRFLVTFTLSLLVLPLAADAQLPVKVTRIGMLSPGSPPATSVPSPFVQGLRHLGYVEGQHIAFERRYEEGNLDRLPDLAAELVRLPVALIWRGELPAPWRPSTRPPPSPLSSLASPIPSGAGWSQASRGQAGTSPDWPPKGIQREDRGSPPNSWSCSKGPCLPSPAWRCCLDRHVCPPWRRSRRGSVRQRG